MSTTRKLALASAMALAAIAMAATSANATAPIEVVDETTGVHCNPCPIEAHGESQITFFGSPISTCEDTFAAEIYEDGRGHVIHLTNENHAGLDCTTMMCDGVGENKREVEWPFSTEEVGRNESVMNVRFCLDRKADPSATGRHCDIAVHVAEPLPHSYVVTTANHLCPDGTRVSGTWEIENPNNPPHVPIVILHP